MLFGLGNAHSVFDTVTPTKINSLQTTNLKAKSDGREKNWPTLDIPYHI